MLALLVTTIAVRGRAEDPWRFLMSCDSRGITGGVCEQVLSEMVDEALRHDVDFVLFPGDLVYGAYVSPAQFEEQLRTWLRIAEPLYDAGIGVYVSRGNHELGDVWNLLPGEAPDPNDNNALRWLGVFGNPSYPHWQLPGNGPAGEEYMTYSFGHRNVFVVCLDQYDGIGHRAVHRVNRPWLDAQLAANTAPHVFVTGHEPAFTTLPRACLDSHPAERDAFLVSIAGAGGRTYMCGHDHFYDHARLDDGDGDPANDLHQLTVSTAGATPYGYIGPYRVKDSSFLPQQIYHAVMYGYLLVEIDNLDVTITWMQRDSDRLIDWQGTYDPNDVWSYTVVPGPIVLSPNGGERLVPASTYVVTWKTVDGAQIDRVDIDFSSDAGASWQPVATTANDGQHEWTVPTIESERCLLRISSADDPALHDTSQRPFAVSQCGRLLRADLNDDCRVDFLDLAVLAGEWLQCGNPFDPGCDLTD